MRTICGHFTLRASNNSIIARLSTRCRLETYLPKSSGVSYDLREQNQQAVFARLNMGTYLDPAEVFPKRETYLYSETLLEYEALLAMEVHSSLIDQDG